jgi:hypothetical protein
MGSTRGDVHYCPGPGRVEEEQLELQSTIEESVVPQLIRIDTSSHGHPTI